MAIVISKIETWGEYGDRETIATPVRVVETHEQAVAYIVKHGLSFSSTQEGMVDIVCSGRFSFTSVSSQTDDLVIPGPENMIRR